MKSRKRDLSVSSAFSLSTVLFIGASQIACTSPPTKDPTPPEVPVTAPEKTVVVEEKPKPPEIVEPELFSLRFDDETIGEVPASLEILETASRGAPATWAVEKMENAPSGPNAFGAIVTKNKGGTYNLALVKDSEYKDVDVSVAVKAISGKEDQGGGPVWRAKDADNYYIARWNPLEDNFRIYFVKDAKRKQLASTKLKLDPKAWHTIRIQMTGDKIKAWINGDMVLEANDSTFPQGGMIGLWTKADAATLFDNLAAQPYGVDR